MILGRWTTVLRGLRSPVIGYLLIAVLAGLAYLLLDFTGITSPRKFLENKEVGKLAHPTSLDLLTSSAAVVAGVTMVASRRFSLLAAPLMALALIPSAAMAGIAVVVGEGKLTVPALERLGMDVGLVVVLGLIVTGLKQLHVHRRRPLP